MEEVKLPLTCWKFDPSYQRFIVLIYICLLGFWINVTYDTPGSLETQIETKFSIPTYEYEYLYSVYSFPNIVLCFFGGILIDRIFGIKWASLIFTCFCVLGQIIVTVGAFCNTYWLLLVGRFIYGLGGESISVILFYHGALWFVGKEVNFVMGLINSIARMGTSFIFLVATPLYNFSVKNSGKDNALGATMSLGIGTSILVLLIAMLIAWEGKRYNKIPSRKMKKNDSEESEVRFRDVVSFPLKFWLVNIIITSFVVSAIVFVSCSQQLLMSKFNYTIEEASQIGSMFNIIGAVSGPVPGIIIDKVGRDLYFVILGMSVGIISLMILAFTPWNPFVSIIMYAIGTATLNACTWSLIALVVQPYQLATAYGVNQSFMNLTITVSSILAGYLLGQYGNVAASLFYMAFLVVGLVCCVILLILDKRDNGILNLPSSKKSLLKEKLTKEQEERNNV